MNYKEVWVDIEGYEGLYQVSDLGRVKSLERLAKIWNGKRRAPEHIIQQETINNGYKRVTLCRENNRKRFLVHRLVAFAFIENTDNKPCVDHINGHSDDNRAINLRWASHSENSNNPVTTKRMKDKARKVPAATREKAYDKNRKKVVQIDPKTKDMLMTFGSIREASEATGISDASISYACTGKRKTGGGYIWKFV